VTLTAPDWAIIRDYRNRTPLKTPVPAAKNRNTTPMDSPVPAAQNIEMLSQQQYKSQRNAQLNPWTAFLRRENHEDDPVHICVCVFVCVFSFRNCLVQKQRSDTHTKIFRSQETKRIKWSNAMLIQRSKIANLTACFFYFCVSFDIQYL